MHVLTAPPRKRLDFIMISVELWRARIGLFNNKGYSGFLSSLFSSYIPFKFHRRRKRERNATQDPSTASQRARINTNTDSSTQEEPLQTSKSPHSASIITSLAVNCSLQQSLLSFFWSSFSQVRGLVSSCLLREALVRLVLLIVIISQALIISGDVETNPGPLACE